MSDKSITQEEYNILIQELMKRKLNIQVHKTDIKTLTNDTCIYKYGYIDNFNDGILREQESMQWDTKRFGPEEMEIVKKLFTYMLS